MKFVKVAVMSAIALAYSSAYAFHSGGVAECEGCHSMHNSFEGTTNVTGTTSLLQGSGPYLLKAQTQSGACLNCHSGPTLSSYHVNSSLVTDPTGVPVNLTPGGDFSWLKITSSVVVRNNTVTYAGERRGHNIIAPDFTFVQDGTQQVAPGGTYPAGSLQCSSCHDPHGKTRRFADGSFGTTGLPIKNSGSYNNSNDPIANIYAVGAYRILGGLNYQPKSTPGYPFTAGVPDAVAPSNYNRAETTQQGQTFVAYGRGMSEWCANCHPLFLDAGYTSGMNGLRHPAGPASGQLSRSNIYQNYNAYVTSGIMTNTTANNAFQTLTPFEVNSGDYTVLKPRANLTGAVDRSAVGTNNVMCLSCHRAHASGFESMLRFWYGSEFMTLGDNAGVATYDSTQQGFTVAQTTQAYYGRPATYFGPAARMQCNKCHAKD